MARISVITVCLNAEVAIGDTIKSILEQTYCDFEYIIKDGVSKDQTISMAESFCGAFEKRNIPYKIVSRQDQGIYDAMNQAVQEAKGDWVVFMNAGDCFANASVLELVARSGYLDTADIIYGDTIRKRNNLYIYTKALDLDRLRYEMTFCHQSTYTRRVLLEDEPYSVQYRVCSDYKFYMQMNQEHKRFAYIPEALSIYDTRGTSSNWRVSYLERVKMLEEMPVRDEVAIQKALEAANRVRRVRFFIEHIWKFVPKTIRERRRRRLDRLDGWKTEKEFFGEQR